MKTLPMENNRRRQGQPVLVDGREGTIECGDEDSGMSIHLESGGHVVVDSREVWRRVTTDPGGSRPVWGHLARHIRKFTEITDPKLIEALAKLQALCRAEGITIQGDFSVWVGDVGYDQLDHLSGKEQTHWNRSKGQVKG